MTLELKPETERLVEDEIRSGHIGSIDELILYAIEALREKSKVTQATVPPQKSRKSLYDLLTQPPFAGSELDLERQRDYPRPVDL